jgi:FlaA1/EpsC-like NDP-sugar epimerase
MRSYFSDVIAVMHHLKEASLNRGVTRYLRQYGISILLYLVATLLGFETAIALRLFVDMYILLLSCTLCCSVFLFIFFHRVKMTRSLIPRRNPHAINVADLLEREIVPLETINAQVVLKGQIILVTGAAGSIGSELCRQLLDYEPELLIALDINESGLFDLSEDLRSRAHPHCTKLCLYIGDITDVRRMTCLFAEKRPNIIFHAAAYKHVPLLEQYADLAIQTNVLATYYLCCLAQKHGVARFVFISTDKAAEPVSVMGASKRLGEMIIQALAQSTDCMTHFCAVRFGNVIGSRGSVIPVFARQIEQGGPLTVTHAEATRYFMTIPEACGLVILTSLIAERRELYLLDMGKPVRIIDLAMKMLSLCGLRMERDIPIVYTGLRPGERLHETLVAPDEELTLTTNGRILRVTQKDKLPTFPMIVQWINTLEHSLLHEGAAQQREHLFRIVREQKLIVIH